MTLLKNIVTSYTTNEEGPTTNGCVISSIFNTLKWVLECVNFDEKNINIFNGYTITMQNLLT
jgi:hypothetical protein